MTYTFREAKYKRGQVNWSLWHTHFLRIRHLTPEKIGSPFLKRISRLLDLDKTLVESEWRRCHAFSAGLGESGSGLDREFSVHDAFYLGLGLDLLNSGINQSDAVFFLQHLRAGADHALPRLMGYKNWRLERFRPDEVPTAPIVLEKERFEWADLTAFVIFSKSEFVEMYPGYEDSPRPLMLAPLIAYGMKARAQELDKLAQAPSCQSYQLVYEVSLLGVCLRDALIEAPKIKRGRKAVQHD